MTARDAHKVPPSAPAQDGLGALLEAERELNEQVRQADLEAARLLAASRERIVAMEAHARQRLDEALRALESEATAATGRAAVDIAVAARARVDHLDAVPDERIEALAAGVLHDFLGVPAPAA